MTHESNPLPVITPSTGRPSGSSPRKKKAGQNPVVTLVGVVLGGAGGVFIAAMILWYFFKIDIAGVQGDAKPKNNKQKVETASLPARDADEPKARPAAEPTRGVLPIVTADADSKKSGEATANGLSLPAEPTRSDFAPTEDVSNSGPEPVAVPPAAVPMPAVASTPAIDSPAPVSNAEPSNTGGTLAAEDDDQDGPEKTVRSEKSKARTTKAGYPRIDGTWDDQARTITVTQKGNTIFAVSEYHDDKDHLVRWEGAGKVEKGGRLVLSLTYVIAPKWYAKKETRLCQVSEDGQSVKGQATSINNRYEFNWTLLNEP